MELTVYKEIAEIEQNHWWFRGRRLIINAVLQKLFLELKLQNTLDIGCGTGATMKDLLTFSEQVEGLESSTEAVNLAKTNYPDLRIYLGSFPETKLDEKYDLITMFDVLEHIKDHVSAINELNAILRPGGFVIITVPAHPSLWSEHDKTLHHQRRYTKASMFSLINQQTNLELTYLNYFNSLLFIPIYIFRKLKKLFRLKSDINDNFLPAKPINKLLELIFSMERYWLPGRSLPFGVSLICVLRKK